MLRWWRMRWKSYRLIRWIRLPGPEGRNINKFELFDYISEPVYLALLHTRNLICKTNKKSVHTLWPFLSPPASHLDRPFALWELFWILQYTSLDLLLFAIANYKLNIFGATHRRTGPVSFRGAEVSCPNILSIACPKIKWFCPNITRFFFLLARIWLF